MNKGKEGGKGSDGEKKKITAVMNEESFILSNNAKNFSVSHRRD